MRSVLNRPIAFCGSVVSNLSLLSFRRSLRTVSIGRVRLEHALQGDCVHVRKMAEVTTKLKKMSEDGPKYFQVISDFDRTLSPFTVKGKPCSTTHGIAPSSSLLPKEFSDKTFALYKKYYPIELSSSLPQEDKIQSMIEWWTIAHKLLVEYGLKREHLEPMVGRANIDLRPGCSLLFDTTNKYDVPLLVFSAGLSDLIAEVIRQKAVYHSNIQILANELQFSEEGELLGVAKPLVHTFNKSQIAAHHKNIFEQVKDRTNVLLLGDSVGDVHMADGFEEMHKLNIVKIGFLNHREEEMLPKYMELYDIVLTGDAPMDIVNSLVVYVLDMQAHIQ